jgi:hypothetical protein
VNPIAAALPVKGHGVKRANKAGSQQGDAVRLIHEQVLLEIAALR